MKQQILQNELKYDRCENALSCYYKLKRDLEKDCHDQKIKQLQQYESQGDEKVLQNTTFKTCKTHIGYCTEHKAEYDELKQAGNTHIVFTNRKMIPDMVPIKGTLLLAQISGLRKEQNGKWCLTTSTLPCPCPPCRSNVTESHRTCIYKQARAIKSEFFQQKMSNSGGTNSDPFGIAQLTVAELRTELIGRGLNTTGRKDVLIARIEQALQCEEQCRAENDDCL